MINEAKQSHDPFSEAGGAEIITTTTILGLLKRCLFAVCLLVMHG